MISEENEQMPDSGVLERISERILSSSYVQALKSALQGEKKIAIIVDGPNILRRQKTRQIKLDDIDDIVKEFGKPSIKKVILNEFASKSLIQAIINSGYEPIVTPYDIYITMAIEVMETLNQNKKIGLFVLGSRHARIAPILLKIKEIGIETVVVGFETGMSIAVKKITDKICFIDIEE